MKQENGIGLLVNSLKAENASLTGKQTLELCSLHWHHCHSNTPGSTGQRSGGGLDWHLVTKATILFIKMWEGQLFLTALGNVTKENVIFKVFIQFKGLGIATVSALQS